MQPLCYAATLTSLFWLQLSLYATTSVSCMSARRVNQLTTLQPNDVSIDAKRRHTTTSPNDTKKGKGRLRKIELSDNHVASNKFSKPSFPLKIATR